MIWYVLKLVMIAVAVWVHGCFWAVKYFLGVRCNVLLHIVPIADSGWHPHQVQVQFQIYNAI